MTTLLWIWGIGISLVVVSLTQLVRVLAKANRELTTMMHVLADMTKGLMDVTKSHTESIGKVSDKLMTHIRSFE